MMKRILLATATFIPLIASAQPVFHPSGSNLTYGMYSHGSSVLNVTRNPAAAASMGRRKDGDGKAGTTVGIGIVSSIGASVEIGAIDNFADEIDQITTDLDQTYTNATDAQTVIDNADQFLLRASEDGYTIVTAGVHIPLMPLVLGNDNGSGVLTFDINAGIQAYAGLLYAPLQYETTNQTIQTNSALYIKGAAVTEASVGYSRPLWNSDAGQLYGGITGKYYQVDLTKNVISLNDVDNGYEDTISDEFDRNLESTSNVGIDLGLLWVANHYTVGATLANANAPEFDYGPLGSDCAQLTGSAQNNCYTAASHSDKIDLNETYTMDPQLTLEASLHSESKNWQLAMSYDTNAVRGPIGNELQWMTVAVGYNSDSWIPAVRGGYRANMAGSELTMATFGLTLFKGLNLDIAYGLEEVEQDGDKIPRTAAVNLGLEMRF